MSRVNGPIPYSDKARKNYDGIFKKKLSDKLSDKKHECKCKADACGCLPGVYLCKKHQQAWDEFKEDKKSDS